MNFINVPYSLIDKRWFVDEMAVRAWVFLATRGILSKSNPIITIKNKVFELRPGETLCTRSYLSKSLKITDSNAKGVTDKLGRSKSIFKQIELLDKGFRNKISRIKVAGIPVPDPKEAFLQVAMTDDISLMWQIKHLAQLYIYLMLSANKFDRITIAGGQILEVKRGELVISCDKIRADLKISEYFLKKTMKYLEGLGLVEKSRCGNDGLYVKLKKYPPVPSKKEKIEEMAVEKTVTTAEVPEKVKEDTEVATVAIQPVQPENTLRKGLPSADWKGWVQNSATKSIVWYAQRRGWKDIGRVNNMITDVGECGLDLSHLSPCLKHLWETFGNNVVDSRDKAVFVDGAYILKYYNFYLTQKNQTLQQSPATEYSSDSHANQQQSQSAAVMGSESELKYAQDIFNEMTACIQSRGDDGVEYVKNWMSNRHCCVSGFDLESRTLYIDIFEEVKEKWDEDKQHLMPFFKHFFGNNIRLTFNILEHSI